MTYRVYIERDLIPQTRNTRKVHIRVDNRGVYLLFFEGEDLKAGMVFQYPWNSNPYLTKGYSSFSW